jgi:U3 small nucleolar RNA-associated protein 7
MATSGVDGQLKLWDVRTYRPLHSYFAPRTATDLDFSDRGLLAAVHGPTVQVCNEATNPNPNPNPDPDPDPDPDP